MSGNAHTAGTSGQDHLHGLQDDDQRNSHGNAETVARQGGGQFEQYRDSAAEQIENLAQNAQSAAQQIDSNDTLGLSEYVTAMAQAMTRLADNLRNKSAEQLLQDAGRLARENPVLFISGSVALGVGLSRLLKAATASSDTHFDTTLSEGSTSGASTSGSSSPGDLTGVDSAAPYDPISPSALAAEERVVTHPHDNDVLHSARPGTGISDTPAMNEFNDDLDDEVTRDGSPKSGLSKGDV
ncbi:hypothetical protein NRB15_16800 [Pseudomonas alliivorans]|uniref:hypothetical protein n=1 Tax=Pseudomonas alliivorans TaxID=2810613 RepID=UPI00211B88AC|nr:hypothetical protein [Pseudomonas alliivorans]MCQ9471997.1 hypothetical protein [Pseudomonas alliivorans]